MRLSFGAIAVQPQNKQQVQEMSQIAYKTKETVDRRYGSESPVLMQAQISQDTITFSATAQNRQKQKTVDSIMANLLRNAGIPFKQF